MTDDEIKQIVASNAKSIQALTSSITELKQEWQKDREEWKRERTQFYDFATEMQREFIDLQRRVYDHGADVRELTIENKRILRYLENLVNRPNQPDKNNEE